MMNNLIVDDDVIDIDSQEAIKKVLTSNWFPWYVSESINRTCSEEELNHFSKFIPAISESLQFVHSFIREGKDNSDYTGNACKLLFAFCNKYNIKIKKIRRIKANFCPRVNEKKEIYFHCPHVDDSETHFVLIYYVSDSDGDTYLFNEKLKDKTDNFFSLDKISLNQTVTPKQGRFLFFNGNRYHAGSHPKKHSMRVVINYNFEIYE